MKFLRWTVILASATAPWAFCQNVAPESDMASIKTLVRDFFGKPIPDARVTITSVGPRKKFTAVGGEARFDKIPFGLYDLDVELPGFLPRKERIRVYQTSLLFYIGLELAPTHSYDRPELSGSIKFGAKNRPDLWVRLQAIYGSDLVENAVDSSGKFELDGMALGRYILLLFQNETLLAIRPVEVLGGKQVVEISVDSSVNRN